jgi:hypothetical protein
MKKLVQLAIEHLATTAPHQAACDMPGTISLLDEDGIDASGAVESTDPSDIGIYMDYATDGLNPQQSSELFDWYNTTWSLIDQVMDDAGYTKVGENDGSGGGLLYGAAVYRPSWHYDLD